MLNKFQIDTKEYAFIHLGILCTEQRSDSQPSYVELGESRECTTQVN